MKAILHGQVVADSDDVNTVHGYPYFPLDAVAMDRFEKAEKTASDLECPHGVQFYDVVVDGQRHPRAAWCYEAPLPAMEQVARRMGFWEPVEVA